MLYEEKKNLIALWLALEMIKSNIVTSIISTHVSVKVVFLFYRNRDASLYGILSVSIK